MPSRPRNGNAGATPLRRRRLRYRERRPATRSPPSDAWEQAGAGRLVHCRQSLGRRRACGRSRVHGSAHVAPRWQTAGAPPVATVQDGEDPRGGKVYRAAAPCALAAVAVQPAGRLRVPPAARMQQVCRRRPHARHLPAGRWHCRRWYRAPCCDYGRHGAADDGLPPRLTQRTRHSRHRFGPACLRQVQT